VIVETMAEEAEKAGVKIVTGDTKVVEKGSATNCSSQLQAREFLIRRGSILVVERKQYRETVHNQRTPWETILLQYSEPGTR
jgi:hypothetical protein